MKPQLLAVMMHNGTTVLTFHVTGDVYYPVMFHDEREYENRSEVIADGVSFRTVEQFRTWLQDAHKIYTVIEVDEVVEGGTGLPVSKIVLTRT